MDKQDIPASEEGSGGLPSSTAASSSLENLSISDEDICSNDDDATQGDTWIEELECALLADCDQATLKKICEGKRIPASLRPDYWRTLLALNEPDGKVKLTSVYDLPNQDELRRDCDLLVEEISRNLSPSPLADASKLRLKSDFESTLTTYVRARPELNYVSGNGWTDILKVLYNLQLSDTQLYQMFFRIVDRYIPKNLSPSQLPDASRQLADDSAIASEAATTSAKQTNSSTGDKSGQKQTKSGISLRHQQLKNGSPSRAAEAQHRQHSEKSIQAYHLLRLLIQYHDPELCSILDSRKVTPNLYVKDWFCSLFARSCTPKLALHIWDMHFKMADPFLIFFAAIVMVVNASDELKNGELSKTDMLNVLEKMPSQLEEDDVEDLYYLVSNHYTNSTPRSIRSYSHLFFMDTFGATYSGNDSPERSSPSLVDLKTCRLTNSLDLSQYLCLPIVPAEIFAFDSAAAKQASSPDLESPISTPPATPVGSTLRYFLVDCRPAEQYNAGHLTKAFHLDCSLMLHEPSSFATAVQALLEIQRQVVASKSNTGGQHLCFIGSGQDEEDRYVNMVVASLLQKNQKYVSIVVGGFDAIHDYVQTKSELKDSFAKFIVDHNEEFCKTCCSKSPEAFERLKAHQAALAKAQQQTSSGGFGSAQALFASTTSFFKGGADKTSTASALSKFTASNQQATATAQQLAQSGVSMLDKFTAAFVSKSSVFKERLVETLNNTSLPASNLVASSGTPTSGARSHVSSQDKLGPRYTGGSFKYDDLEDLNRGGPASLRSRVGSLLQSQEEEMLEEPCQEIQVEQWQRENSIVALYKCAQIKGNLKYPGYIGLNATHLWILREIPHNKGFASIAAKRPLDMVVQITSKRRQPDFIIFRYGYANKSSSASPESTATTGNSPDIQNNDNRDQQTNTTTAPDEQNKLTEPKQFGLPTIIASDHLHIPQAFEVIRLIKREIVRIMDENSRHTSTSQAGERQSKLQSVPAGSGTRQDGTTTSLPIEEDAAAVRETTSQSEGGELVESEPNEVTEPVKALNGAVSQVDDPKRDDEPAADSEATQHHEDAPKAGAPSTEDEG